MTMRDKYAVLIGALKFLFFVPRARYEQHMWEEFENEFGWIPEGLHHKGIVLVKRVHEREGWGSMPGILSDRDTQVFALCHKGTLLMLGGASNIWRPSKRREYGTYLISLMLAIEWLGCDFLGWGTAHPDAKRQADEILDQFFVHNRTRLMDFYMPLRAQLDQVELSRAFGPEGTVGVWSPSKHALLIDRARSRARLKLDRVWEAWFLGLPYSENFEDRREPKDEVWRKAPSNTALDELWSLKAGETIKAKK